MKTKSITKNLILSITGFLMLAFGAYLAKYGSIPEVISTLPYLFIGIGAGIFGHNLAEVSTILSYRKDPTLAKSVEIEEKDERNIAIRNKAKAKAYDLMIIVFGVLLLSFALIDADLSLILTIVFAYLFIVITNIYYLNRYNKEM